MRNRPTETRGVGTRLHHLVMCPPRTYSLPYRLLIHAWLCDSVYVTFICRSFSPPLCQRSTPHRLLSKDRQAHITYLPTVRIYIHPFFFPLKEPIFLICFTDPGSSNELSHSRIWLRGWRSLGRRKTTISSWALSNFHLISVSLARSVSRNLISLSFFFFLIANRCTVRCFTVKS